MRGSGEEAGPSSQEGMLVSKGFSSKFKDEFERSTEIESMFKNDLSPIQNCKEWTMKNTVGNVYVFLVVF